MKILQPCLHTLVLTLLLIYTDAFKEKWTKKKPPTYRSKHGWQPHCPATCVCHYNSIYCDAMGLRRVPRPLPDNTQAIYLRDNYIRRVPFRRLRGLKNLKHLLMKGNRIVQVEGHAFKHLVQLVSLSLTDNLLSYLSPKLFQNQANLQVLSIRNNKLRHVRGLFHSLKKLQLLNLANNRIRYIGSDMFKTTRLLRVLDLHNNRIKHIPADAFSHLPNLRFLVLRDNQLTFIKFKFARNVHLELLDLTNCNLKRIAVGLPQTINDLRLSENKITELQEDAFNTTRKIRLLVLNSNQIRRVHRRALANLQQLYDLYIGKNKLTQIPYGIPKNIHGIYANFNNITSLGEANFNYHSTLEFLFLRNNNLKEIEQTAFHGLKNLRSLDLSRNSIMSLKPYTFSRMKSLELLDLSKNPITELKYGCFHGLHRLSILQLSSVATKSLVTPSTFRDMENLRFLDLSNSASLVQKMAKSKAMFNAFKSVEDLNMMNDLLHRLPADFPNHFPVLKVVKLIGNPWHCDQSIIWLTQWMRNRTVSFYAPNFMKCATPRQLAGKRLNTLSKSDILRANQPTKRPSYSANRRVQVDSLGVIFKAVDKKSKKKVSPKGYVQRKRQGLSNSIIKVIPGDNVNIFNHTIRYHPMIRLTPNHNLVMHKTMTGESQDNTVTAQVTVEPQGMEDTPQTRANNGYISNEIQNLQDQSESNRIKAEDQQYDSRELSVEKQEEHFNMIDTLPQRSHYYSKKQAMKSTLQPHTTQQVLTKQVELDSPVEYTHPQYYMMKEPKSSRLVYNDRVFENVELAERFLLQTYDRAAKRTYRHKDNRRLENEYRTKHSPMYDDSSGFIDEEK